MLLLVGSKALSYWGHDYLSPNAKRSWDIDWICTYDSFKKLKKDIKITRSLPMTKGRGMILFTKSNIHECEIGWEDSPARYLLELVKNDSDLAEKMPYQMFGNDYYIAKPNLIFTLKKSHRFLKDSPHFLKTMYDYKHLRDNCGCVVPDQLKDWYKERTKQTYWYKHPNLNVSKDEFFKDDGIPYIYDHDTIHLSMAHLDRPAYEYFKDDQAEVMCSKKKFFECDEKTRLFAVLEESYVLALERSQIPAPGVWTPRKSFETALAKISSSITSGWFREYAYENYFKALELYDDNYVKKFWQDVDKGIVKKLDN